MFGHKHNSCLTVAFDNHMHDANLFQIALTEETYKLIFK